jgi:hypothetical protein
MVKERERNDRWEKTMVKSNGRRERVMAEGND